MRGLFPQGQLPRLRPMQKRQIPPDLQNAEVRKTHREEAEENQRELKINAQRQNETN